MDSVVKSKKEYKGKLLESINDAESAMEAYRDYFGKGFWPMGMGGNNDIVCAVKKAIMEDNPISLPNKGRGRFY